MGIFVTALLQVNVAYISLPAKEFGCKILQFPVYTFKIPHRFDMDYVSDSVFEEFLPRYSRSVFQRLAESRKITEQNSNSAGLNHVAIIGEMTRRKKCPMHNTLTLSSRRDVKIILYLSLNKNNS